MEKLVIACVVYPEDTLTVHTDYELYPSVTLSCFNQDYEENTMDDPNSRDICLDVEKAKQLVNFLQEFIKKNSEEKKDASI